MTQNQSGKKCWTQPKNIFMFKNEEQQLSKEHPYVSSTLENEEE